MTQLTPLLLAAIAACLWHGTPSTTSAQASDIEGWNQTHFHQQ